MKIKYFNNNYPRLEKINKGDWIDLRVNSIKNNKLANSILQKTNSIKYYKGDILKFGLGVAMELPKGYEALVAPRSSTFKHWGLIQTNSLGIIDNSFCGDGDEWLVEFIATRDGELRLFERVCQFRIIKNQPMVEFEEVEKLTGENRGGYGTTGK